MDSTSANTWRPPVRERAPALPAFNVADGACSFRHGLTARDRAALDRAVRIVGRHLRERSACDSPGAVKTYLQLQLAGETSEHFGVLFLDAQHCAIAFERMFTGTLAQTNVHPREVVRAALRHHAASVVLAHNHPSGGTNPSNADRMLTDRLRAALQLVEVRVLDHVIVAGDRATSMAQMGWM